MDLYQWPFQDSRLEVPTIYIYIYIYGLLFRAKFQGISPQILAKPMVLTYLRVLDPEDLPSII